MKKLVWRYLIQLWINPLAFIWFFLRYPKYITHYFRLKSEVSQQDFLINLNYPCLHDAWDNGWTANGHYFHQDLLIARKIFQSAPLKHVDIGSRVDGFCAHVATFREIEVFDIRPMGAKVQAMLFKTADLMSLDSKYIDYTDSISSLHAIEHFGLWRYGDTIDINWHIKGLDSIYHILKKGGTFYFSVPISYRQRIEFNAHRVFSIPYLMTIFSSKFEIKSFSYVDDKGSLYENIDCCLDTAKNTFGLEYGCGIFELIKI